MKSFKEYYLESTGLFQKSGHLNHDGEVFVYYNINLSKKLGRPLFSIKDIKTGKVIGHDDKIMIADAKLKVSDSGNKRVNLQGRKNVHAGIVGNISKEQPRVLSTPITYNPYKYKSFVKKEDETPVFKAALVSLIDRSVTADGIE